MQVQHTNWLFDHLVGAGEQRRAFLWRMRAGRRASFSAK
jgi:hypothetical protein